MPIDAGLLARTADRQIYLDRILRSVDQVITTAPYSRTLLTERGFAAVRSASFLLASRRSRRHGITVLTGGPAYVLAIWARSRPTRAFTC